MKRQDLLSPRTRRTVWTAVALLGLCIVSSARAYEFPKAAPPSNDIRLDNRVAVPMRDGVILYADVYRPAAEGKYPVIVSRTPYSTERPPAAYSSALFFAQTRLRLRLARRARAARVRGPLGAVSRRHR